MATKKEIKEQTRIALKEVGKIQPWFDEDCNCWVFAHENYPVEYGGDSPEEVRKNYPKYLEEFIAHRLEGRIAAINEKETKGKAGLRKKFRKLQKMRQTLPMKQIRVPYDIAAWLSHPGTINHIREILQAYSPPHNHLS